MWRLCGRSWQPKNSGDVAGKLPTMPGKKTVSQPTPHLPHGLVARIHGSHPWGPGSIPGAGTLLVTSWPSRSPVKVIGRLQIPRDSYRIFVAGLYWTNARVATTMWSIAATESAAAIGKASGSKILQKCRNFRLRLYRNIPLSAALCSCKRVRLSLFAEDCWTNFSVVANWLM